MIILASLLKFFCLHWIPKHRYSCLVIIGGRLMILLLHHSQDTAGRLMILLLVVVSKTLIMPYKLLYLFFFLIPNLMIAFICINFPLIYFLRKKKKKKKENLSPHLDPDMSSTSTLQGIRLVDYFPFHFKMESLYFKGWS